MKKEQIISLGMSKNSQVSLAIKSAGRVPGHCL